MISIEFRQVRTGSPAALVPAGDPATIPSVGDVVFVPDSEAPWNYAYLRVMGRQFFYDQHGALTMISLTCEDGPSEHAPAAALADFVNGCSNDSMAPPHDPDETVMVHGRD